MSDTDVAVLACDQVEEGGETVFPVLELRVAPRQGRLLVFHNCSHDSPSVVGAH